MTDRSVQWKQKFESLLRPLIVATVTLILSGCLTTRPHVEMNFTSGAAIDSLSSKASLAYNGLKRSITGSGFLLYQKPDQIRMVVLSPFGSVLQEVFVSGELVTIIDSGNGTAFSGSFKELPVQGDFSAWRYIHWLIDIDPPDSLGGSAVINRINRFGESEEAAFENGLLLSKTTVAGGRVSYGNYSAVHGVAIPLEIRYETALKEQFTIRLDEPEINAPITEGAFTPDLVKYRLYPLSILK